MNVTKSTPPPPPPPVDTYTIELTHEEAAMMRNIMALDVTVPVVLGEKVGRGGVYDFMRELYGKLVKSGVSYK